MARLRFQRISDISTEMQFAARMTPILYEKLRGSPRRVKRFLNDLNVRSAIAERRGIELDVSVVAKLMVLELLLSEEFDMVLGWLARRRTAASAYKTPGDRRPVLSLRISLTGSKTRSRLTTTSKKPRSKNGKSTSAKPDDESDKDERFTRQPDSMGEASTITRRH